MPIPTDAMAEEAERGLEWRREYGRGGTEVGVARARDIANKRDLSMDTVRRMASFFARHEVDKEAEGFSPGEDGYPSAGRIAWALWGGDPGQSWANALVDADSEEDRAETRPYEGEHAARIRDPEGFDSFRRVNNEGGQGVDFVYGILDGEAQVQSIRFKTDFFTVEQAQEWLAENNFEPLLFEPAAPVDDERNIVLYSFQILESDMNKRAEPDELSVGDYVTWSSSGGEVYGRIQRIVRDGEINVPDTDFTITGTEDDPAALIMVYREVEDGWAASGTLVGHKFSTLTKVSARYYDNDKKKERHIKRIEETEDEIIVVFAKADNEDHGEVDMQENQSREVRPTQKIEVRAEKDGGVRVTGYAAVFGEETNIGGMFTEVIERGAFASALERGDDVVFLINHAGLPLARTRSGTLKLREDERGLFVDTYLDPNDPDVRAIIPKMKRGDLDKMSFAFIPTRQDWDDSGDMPRRSIRDLQLYDVSIVTTPAYDGTEIGLRSLQQYREEQRKNQAARRLRMKSRLAG
jgi:uncharacterized protein